jgi:hypothetical protein
METATISKGGTRRRAGRLVRPVLTALVATTLSAADPAGATVYVWREPAGALVMSNDSGDVPEDATRADARAHTGDPALRPYFCAVLATAAER